MKMLSMAAILAAVGTSIISIPRPAHAGGTAALDPCGAPLPVYLAFISGPRSAETNLRGGGATMELVQFPGGLNAMAQRLHDLDGGPPLVRNDQIAEFTFFTPQRTHIYGGPVHVFAHGAYQHVCRAGTVMVDAHGNTTEQANPYRVAFRFDGWIYGTRAWGDAWTARGTSASRASLTAHLSGITATRTVMEPGRATPRGYPDAPLHRMLAR